MIRQETLRRAFAPALFAMTTVAALGQSDETSDSIAAMIGSQFTPAVDEARVKSTLIEQARYLSELTITSLDDTYAANAQIYTDAFNAPFDINNAGFGGVPAFPGTIWGSDGVGVIGTTTIDDLQLWPLDLDQRFAQYGVPENALEMFSFTGSFDGQQPCVGIMARVDLEVMGTPGAQGPGDWRVDSYSIRAFVDETVIDPTIVGAFVAQSVNEGFAPYGSIAGWLDSQMYAANSNSGGGDGGSLHECLTQAYNDMQEAIDEAWLDYRTAALPLEGIVNFGDPWAEASVGAGLGALGGSVVPGAGTAVGAICGGLIGFASGCLAWAMNSPSAEEYEEALSLLQQQADRFEQRVCDAINAAAAAIEDCFDRYDPGNAELAGQVARAWARSQGC